MATRDELKELKNQSYKKISENPCTTFPEFEFKHDSKGWYSGNALKLDGTQGTVRGKVWIYENNPGFFYDFRGSATMSFWEYLEKVQRISQPFVWLMDMAAIEIPKEKHSGSFDKKALVQLIANTHPFILKHCLKLFASTLLDSPNSAKVRTYLTKRGYDDSLVQKMKLGAIPELPTLRLELENLNLESKYVNYFVKGMEKYIEHHSLAIPCYGKGGQLEGFTFRATDTIPDDVPKYLNMPGLSREAGIYNVPYGTKEIIVVEGVFDALLARHGHQMREVVPLQGSGLNEEQLTTLAEIGVDRLVLCLDHDHAGESATRRIVERILKNKHPFEVYIVTLPFDVKDVDELIVQHGIDAFKQCLQEAIGVGEYMAVQLCRDFPHSKPNLSLPSRQRSLLLAACAEYYKHLADNLLEQHDMMRVIYQHIDDPVMPFSLLQHTITNMICEV